MKRFAGVFISALVLGLPLFLGLACKVDMPGAPNNFQTALETVEASNPTLTTTPTPTITDTPTVTPTATVTDTPTVTPTVTP